MLGFRLAAYTLLAGTAFWIAAYRGLWYDSHVFARKSSAFEFHVGDFSVSGGKARILLFFVAPILLAAVCGSLLEAARISRKKLRKVQSSTPLGTARICGTVSSSIDNHSAVKQPTAPNRVWTILTFNTRPLGEGYPWVTVGEVLMLLTYVLVMTTMVWQGTNFKLQAHLGDTMPCAEDPSERCKQGTDQVTTSSSVIILKNIAKYMGFAAAIQFSLVLIPVSRDSRIWPAIGVPFERAVLYHTALGHLSLFSLFSHGMLYMAYYVVKHGWGYAVRSAFYYDGDDVNVPAGFIAGLFALPMWILSLPFVRRQHYRLFKTSHFLFVGVFGAGMAHYDGFVHYLLAGFVLYLVHAVSRLGNWNWWSVFKQCFFKSDAAATRGCGTANLLHLSAGDEYTRLVLRNPPSFTCGNSNSAARGGLFVYISSPALLGTIEAHPMSVALRGAPPCLWNAAFADEGVFTLYVKTMGSWTRALHKQEGDNLTVHVDGFYGDGSTLASMKNAKGFQRVVLFAGGSGVTSFTAMIQDWCEAFANSEDVPEIHLVWSCRRMSEIRLLGEALPSFLAAAPAGLESRFTMSVFCSGKNDSDGSQSVSWPVVKSRDNGAARGVSTLNAVLDSLNSGIITLIAGGGALAGWFWAENVAEGALLRGVFVLALMTAVPACLLVVYGWATRVALMLSVSKQPFRASSRKRYVQLRQMAGSHDDPEEAVGTVGDTSYRTGGASRTFPVVAGRAPIRTMLLSERERALHEAIDRVKVLVSGPSDMVDTVMVESRKISWKVFDVEASSREF